MGLETPAELGTPGSARIALDKPGLTSLEQALAVIEVSEIPEVALESTLHVVCTSATAVRMHSRIRSVVPAHTERIAESVESVGQM